VKKDVAAVILATGFEGYDPTEMADSTGYGILPGWSPRWSSNGS
jgi:heterodisulfide reductase subunit A-like polyferredoxin